MAQREASEGPVKSKGGSTEGVSSFVEGAHKSTDSSGESENSRREPYAETVALIADR